jgi:hypothetical protein
LPMEIHISKLHLVLLHQPDQTPIKARLSCPRYLSLRFGGSGRSRNADLQVYLAARHSRGRISPIAQRPNLPPTHHRALSRLTEPPSSSRRGRL